MPVNHAKEFLKYVLYFHTFLSELQIAPIIPILGIDVPNLVQGHLRTCYLLIWVSQLDFQETGLLYYTTRECDYQNLAFKLANFYPLWGQLFQRQSLNNDPLRK